MRHLAITAAAAIAVGLSIPGVAHATSAPSAFTLVPAQTCSIKTSTGTCFSAGEFCPHADLGLTTTAANGNPIRCEQDGQFTRWLNVGTPATSSASPTPSPSSSASAIVPVGGIPAGGGGLAQTSQPAHDDAASVAGLAAGAVAAATATVLVIRKRRGQAER